jgi:hypothetical protein
MCREASWKEETQKPVPEKGVYGYPLLMPIKNHANHYTMRAGIEASSSRQPLYVNQADIN